MEHPIAWYDEHDDFEGAKMGLEKTSPRWKGKWFEVCEKIFNRLPILASHFILCPAEKAVKEITEVPKRRTKSNTSIFISNDCPSLLDEANEKCYLFEFLNQYGKSICSKVGTTTRTVKQRLTEELRSKTYVEMGAVAAIIHRVYDCGNIPAEGLESFFRAEYIKKYPASFKKNDRFINEKFDLIEADKIAEKYLAIGA